MSQINEGNLLQGQRRLRKDVSSYECVLAASAATGSAATMSSTALLALLAPAHWHPGPLLGPNQEGVHRDGFNLPKQHCFIHKKSKGVVTHEPMASKVLAKCLYEKIEGVGTRKKC